VSCLFDLRSSLTVILVATLLMPSPRVLRVLSSSVVAIITTAATYTWTRTTTTAIIHTTATNMPALIFQPL
jgi:hypothetical protein